MHELVSLKLITDDSKIDDNPSKQKKKIIQVIGTLYRYIIYCSIIYTNIFLFL